MKITIYELLGLVKDGKIPEKIIFNGYEYLYHDKEHGYCRSDYDCTYICIDSEYYLFDILNDEVEILEEEKKIPEKIKVKDYDKCIHDVTHKEKEFSLDIRELQIRYNDLLDYLKSKGDK